jgi:hypothetical protein
MLERLLNTPEDPVLTIVRVVLGVVMFAHGAQKMLGWFGGYGFHGTIGFFHEQLKVPSVFGLLAIMAEFLGSICLLLGLFTRVAGREEPAEIPVSTLSNREEVRVLESCVRSVVRACRSARLLETDWFGQDRGAVPEPDTNSFGRVLSIEGSASLHPKAIIPQL